jgi:hypothetical protein
MKTWSSFFGLLLLSGTAFGESIDERCLQNGTSACVDWENGVVLADGIGVPSESARSEAQRSASAQRAARLDAARNALEMVKGINLSSNTTMEEAMVTSDSIRSQVQGKVYGLRPMGEPRYFSDGSVKIRVEAQLRQMVPQVAFFQPPVEIAPPVEITSASDNAPTRIDMNRVYTGLVIDARGTGAQPAMSPRVFDEEGKELYGSAYVDREFVLKHGMAGYVKTLEQAQENDRVEGNPLVLKAVGIAGENKTDLVLSDSDADRLRELAANLNFLREARVVILVD